MAKLFILAFAILALLACNQQIKSDKVQQPTLYTIAQLDARLQKVDSMVLVFYTNPLGTDSLRYTRYYKQYSTTDTATIAFVKTQLNDTATKIEKVKPCRSEGKIWCFANGNIVQTLYFSSYSDACSHLYIIYNGFFYYAGINPSFIDLLKTIKSKAVTP